MIFMFLSKHNRNYSSLWLLGKSSTFVENFQIGNMKTKEQLKRDTASVLRGLRKKSQDDDIRLTQENVAYDAGISVRYYNDIENGKKLPTLEVLMKIAYAYKMTLAEICKQIEQY